MAQPQVSDENRLSSATFSSETATFEPWSIQMLHDRKPDVIAQA